MSIKIFSYIHRNMRFHSPSSRSFTFYLKVFSFLLLATNLIVNYNKFWGVWRHPWCT